MMSSLATLGIIRIDRINGEFIRLTIDTRCNSRYDELQADGATLDEALLGLHEQVEEIQ